MIVSRLLKKKYIIRTIGQLMFWSLKQGSMHKKIYLFLIEKSNIESSSCIHMTSQLEVNEFKENFSHPMQINIPLGISIPQNKQKHIVKKKFVNYLFLSRIHPKKQLDLILKTLSIINKRGFYSWTLEIVGDGDKNYLNYLKNLSYKFNIDEKIKWHGFLQGEEKFNKIKNADWLILPSHSENFGIAVAESLSFGLPVIISPNIGIAPFVEKYGAGYVVEPDKKKLCECLMNKANSAPNIELRKSSVKLAKEVFSWNIISKKLLKSYNKILFN